jgi:hydroxymethylpyrimidine/phosphomethylpyrimidine kinase
MSAITSVTAQNTVSVMEFVDLEPDFIQAQIDAVLSDIGADAVKTGMLSNGATIRTVAARLRSYRMTNLVVDPVMVSTSGDRLIRHDAIRVLKNELFPLALVVTPNLREAELLSGTGIETQKEVQEAARRIHALGPNAVLIKGGHSEDARRAVDYFYDGECFIEFESARIATKNTHGSGCTFGAAIAANLALGKEIVESIRCAKKFITGAIQNSYSVGSGPGCLGHFRAVD